MNQWLMRLLVLLLCRLKDILSEGAGISPLSQLMMTTTWCHKGRKKGKQTRAQWNHTRWKKTEQGMKWRRQKSAHTFSAYFSRCCSNCCWNPSVNYQVIRVSRFLLDQNDPSIGVWMNELLLLDTRLYEKSSSITLISSFLGGLKMIPISGSSVPDREDGGENDGEGSQGHRHQVFIRIQGLDRGDSDREQSVTGVSCYTRAERAKRLPNHDRPHRHHQYILFPLF